MELRMGAIAPPLTEQLAGLGFEQDAIEHFEKDRQAILRLKIRGMISESACDFAFRRLIKSIGKAQR